MSRISKLLLTLALTFVGLCYCPNKVKADAFGFADSALLVQQILQYFQDMDIGDVANLNFGELIDGLDRKVRGVKKIINIFNDGKQGFETFNNVIQVTQNLIYTTEIIGSYMNYISTIGDTFQLDQCYRAYSKFDRKTKVVINQMHKTLTSLKDFDSEGSSNILNSMDKIITGANNALNTLSHECISDLIKIIREENTEEQAGAVEQMVNITII